MELDLDPTSPVPLYRQIVEHVRRLVALGALEGGDRLPPVRDLAARARVNRNTVARAVQELERAGVVRTRVGQGTFVVDGRPRIDPGRRDESLDRALDRVVVEARTLGVPLEELGWRLARRIEAFRKERDRSEGASGTSGSSPADGDEG
jgi:GntR family transcriptional regulator